MNPTYFHPERYRKYVKNNSSVNISFVAKTSDIRNFSQNIRSDKTIRRGNTASDPSSFHTFTLSHKLAVFPAFSSRKVTLGQMRKIGIHFIIYPVYHEKLHK